jgi:heme/copper-type cytochrome/quinol oxidase subunit 3
MLLIMFDYLSFCLSSSILFLSFFLSFFKKKQKQKQNIPLGTGFHPLMSRGLTFAVLVAGWPLERGDGFLKLWLPAIDL